MPIVPGAPRGDLRTGGGGALQPEPGLSRVGRSEEGRRGRDGCRGRCVGANGSAATPITVALLLAFVACGPDRSSPDLTDPGEGLTDGPNCRIPVEDIRDGGVGRDGIVALTDPPTVAAHDPDAGYVSPENRVVGLRVGDEALAVPHNILWWHEVVNLTLGDRAVAVTYCPLTGSSLTFDRGAVEDTDLGVSGLLWRNNLILFDRREEEEEETLWSQMFRRGICGNAAGRRLPMFPAVEMTWEAWQALHPDTEVVSSETGSARDYLEKPNPDYARPDNPNTLFPREREDDRRPPKERLFGIPLALDGGMAFPFGELERFGARAVEQATPEGRVVVFWKREAAGAAAYFTELDGEELSFSARGERVVDEETGSRWNLMGEAVDGPLEGRTLEPYPEAYVAFWFAWADFQPETFIWRP